MIRFGVLGPLTVFRHGEPVLAASRPRRLLAALLSRAGQPVSTEELADAMWDGEPPATARKTLQVYVHRVRHALGARERVPYDGAGYRIVLMRDELDAVRFADLVGRAHTARREARPEQADDLFGQALDLWRGEPYADLAGMAWLDGEVRRLNEQHLQAREGRLAVRLDLGRHAELIPELTDLISAHPYREQARAWLMLALYRCGRQADALAVFRSTRELLTEQLGVEPGPELQWLHEAVLRADSRLSHVAVADLGPDDVVGPGTPPEGGPPPGPKPPAQLPADHAGFIGRTQALRQLDALLASGPGHRPAPVVISAIAGTAGIGKTTLAVHWAHRIAGKFPDGQLYVNLRGFDPCGSPMSHEEAVRALLDGLAVPPEAIPASLQAQAALLRSTVAGKRVLIVLDNARNAEQVRPLLPGAGGCLVVITSRHELAGLVATEGAHQITLDLLSSDEAREFMARRLGRHRTEGEAGAVDQIINACARLPLALAVAAARAAARPHFPLAALVSALHDVRDRLEPFAGDDAATNVRAVFSWSYHALGADAASLFRLLGLHPSAEFVTGVAASLAGVSPHRARRLLAELTGAHVLAEAAPDRFRFHDLLRAYAAGLADSSDSEGERRDAAHRMLDHYLHSAWAGARLLYPHRYAMTVAPPSAGVTIATLTDHADALAWFTSEHTALLAAARQAELAGFDTHAWQLAWSMGSYLDRRGHFQDQIAVTSIGLSAAERLGDLTGQALCHHSLGIAYSSLDTFDGAHRHHDRSIELFRHIGDDSGLAHAYLNQAVAFDRQERRGEALHHAKQALNLFTGLGHRSGQAKALNTVGWCHAMLDEHGEALTHCQQAMEILQELGDRYGEALTWDSIAYAHHRLGHHDIATTCYERSIALWQILGDPNSAATVLDRLADNYEAAGDREVAEKARQRAREALAPPG